MKRHLFRIELARVRRLMQKAKRSNTEQTVVEKAIPFILGILGLFVFAYTLVLFSAKPTDYGLKWVLIPGSLSGLVLILAGLLCSILIRRRNEKKGPMIILRKPLL